MNTPDLKEPIKLSPPFAPNWDSILKWTSLSIIIITGIAFLSRLKTFLIMAEALDVVIILSLLSLAACALVIKSRGDKAAADESANKSTPPSQS